VASINSNKRFELELLRKEIAKYDGKENKDSDSDTDSSGGSESDDNGSMMIAREAKLKKGWKPRASVSAEAYGEWNKKEDFVPRSIPKSKETTESIKNKILKNFMFSNLKDADVAIVINAMNVVEAKAGDMVIKEGDSGDEMYLVGSGKYTCFKTFPGNSSSTHLRYYVAGEAFGEL
jgi:cAMP-dependent protein kinase regulator